jgi:hypothetical protein
MGEIAVNLAAVVGQIMKCGRLAVLMEFGPIMIHFCGCADHPAYVNDGIAMKGRKKEILIEAIDSSADSIQAIENVLTVQQILEPGEPLRIDHP